MNRLSFLVIFLAVVVAIGGTLPPATAQGTQVTLSNPRVNTDAPVEVDAETLAVDRTAGLAIFTGDVLVVQGELQLQADKVTVLYTEGLGAASSEIREVQAEGNVLMVSGPDAAESQTAVYRPAINELRMNGDVVLNQGPVIIAGQALVLDLVTGIGQMEGRVRTVLQPQ